MNKFANTVHEDPDFENVCIKESVEFRDQLSHLDKVDDALVFIEPLSNEINRVHVTVQVKDDINNSDIDNISNYIGDYFEELNKEQLAISYVDSYNIRHLEPESSFYFENKAMFQSFVWNINSFGQEGAAGQGTGEEGSGP